MSNEPQPAPSSTAASGDAPAAEATPNPGGAAAAAAPAATLGSAAYELIRQRLQTQAGVLRERLNRLDARRQEVFGNVEFKLLQSDRVTTAHNCVPRDMVQLGRNRFLFGFNVQFGLKKDIELSDVFGIYERSGADGKFQDRDLAVLQDKSFIGDFKRLYNVYERATFDKFSLIDGSLFMVFRVGAGLSDIAVFKWDFNGGQLRYIDGRSETEFRKVGFLPPHEFRWRIPDRESFRYGEFPHVSIEDRVFVECVNGDLTIKVEDNTASGEGIYAEPVEETNQKVDDAEIAFAVVEHLILLKIRPYKEDKARYFIFNEKQQTVVRVDSIGQSCALLPEDHGLVFPDGYYLGSGELKQFESREGEMILERVINAPNGEDALYVFYNRKGGVYVLMPYRLILQKIEERISCHGFSLFSDGHLLLFRGDEEPQKHHTVQLRQTPFYVPGNEPPGQREAFLYQVGNKEVVRCLAECNEAVTLASRSQPYAELYADLVKRSGAILDSYPWLSSSDGFELDAALKQVRETADKAVEEFDKVRRLQREATQRLREARQHCDDRFSAIRRSSFRALEDFVSNLASLRHLRGELIALKEVRYVDVPEVDRIEQTVIAQTSELAQACVKFLLKPEALDPYRKRAAEHLAAADKIAKAADGRKLEQAATAASGELEMLVEIVNSLRIDDATEATRIIDGITSIYATLNQVKAALKNRLHTLAAAEGAAQFGAQMKLLGQSAASYLDLCNSPVKCEEYLNRISVQLEELEGAFADFEEYTVQIAEKRTALYEAFEQRKLALIEQRNRKTTALMTAAERILKAVQNRLGGFKSIEDIHAYMAADLMIAKVRDIISQLLELGDSVKADDLQGRVKSAQQEAVRQLKDRQELFVGGADLIQLGKHQFNINTQPLDVTMVIREGKPHLHLTSTKFFEPIDDPQLLATRAVWDQEVVAENPEVYRAEFLAAQLLKSIESRPLAAKGESAGTMAPAGRALVPAPGGVESAELAAMLGRNEAERLLVVQEFMAPRYQESYTKGVHDLDAAKIFEALLLTHAALKLARYHPSVRACALVFWHGFCPADARALWASKLAGFAERNRLFPGDPVQSGYVSSIRALIETFISQSRFFAAEAAAPAAEYLFFELISGDTFVISQEAEQFSSQFRQHLAAKRAEDAFQQARTKLLSHPESEFELVRDWVRGFSLERPESIRYIDEISAVLFCGADLKRSTVRAATTSELTGLRGSHSVVRDGRYRFDYLDFRVKLERYEREVVPRFEEYQRLKQQWLERERVRLRLDEFKPKVLTSFVRNQLIDQVYLPLVGDNLAKQLGAAGAAKRTDLMGLLLLISPPGYGKTTLMEYVASRLGIVFIKINGPAIGHAVTSLDPEEAPNAAAREEIQKLNLALEMGDNAMICVDDIQHCNPEFLQKFISLCDGQRRIEGVWRGKSRTYDLRGRKIVVVMAGNPYTESGQKFKIPDMLANRADTYNLGDILGGSAEWFKASYIENSITSNPVLAPLANKNPKDIRAFIRMAESGSRDSEGFEGSYSQREVEEILAVMKKLVTIREVVLQVNLEYIHSAAQADEFRTEPPFRLQGSYRNMNRLAEKVISIMTDDEVRGLLLNHYKGESQTLTTGAEANLLKFKHLIGAQSPEEQARWGEITSTFKRNQLARTGDSGDPVGRLVGQLSAFHSGLEAIQKTLETQLAKVVPAAAAQVVVDFSPIENTLEALRTAIENSVDRGAAPAAATPPSSVAAELAGGLLALREDLSRAITAVHSGSMAEKIGSLSHEMEMIHSTLATLKDIAARQRDHLRNVEEMLAARAKQGTVEIELTQEMLNNERAFLDKFHKVLEQAQQDRTDRT